MIYITGDTHGTFRRIHQFCSQQNTNKDDIMIILGDSGINYYDGFRAYKLKQALSRLPITLFCIHGNHETRAENIGKYKEKKWNGGIALIERAYPNIVFAKDGEIYTLDGKSVCVCGGAYSVDKHYRLQQGYNWWADEQPSKDIKRKIEETLSARNWKTDIILTHTCPLKYEPVEVFLPFIDQSTVDKTTEEWLDSIEDKLDYSIWYAGHYHTDTVKGDKLCLLFTEIIKFGDILNKE